MTALGAAQVHPADLPAVTVNGRAARPGTEPHHLGGKVALVEQLEGARLSGHKPTSTPPRMPDQTAAAAATTPDAPLDTQVRLAATPTLDLAYEQTGPDSGAAEEEAVIVLLHGFPYDVRSYDGVRRGLAAAVPRARVLAPYLRGYGPTRYRAVETLRSGQQAAIAQDVVDLLDALKIGRPAVLVGYDWGGRAAGAVAALWPERVKALVAIGGYTIQDIAKAATTPAQPEAIHREWYQWYFQTEQGRAGLTQQREAFCRHCWQLWSPTWTWDEALFAATARSFANPDFVDTVIHSYRHRHGNAPGDPALEGLEARLAPQPKITVPTVVLHGADDGVSPPASSAGQETRFTAGRYERRVLVGVGHCPPQEAPDAVVGTITALL